jgi:formylglycine-generating enzyme required for sulfatase activity
LEVLAEPLPDREGITLLGRPDPDRFANPNVRALARDIKVYRIDTAKVPVRMMSAGEKQNDLYWIVGVETELDGRKAVLATNVYYDKSGRLSSTAFPPSRSGETARPILGATAPVDADAPPRGRAPRDEPIEEVNAVPLRMEWIPSKPARVEFTKTEITVGQFKECTEAGACSPQDDALPKAALASCNWGHPGRVNHPMNCVDWFAADRFCRWAGGRLPTKKEWQAEAANGGKWDWPWGDEPKVDCERAIWGTGDTIFGGGVGGCGRNGTWPVCSKPKGNSRSGLCDMSGNVSEWTSTVDRLFPEQKVVRGGAWSSDLTGVLLSHTDTWMEPNTRYSGLGFRCVRVARRRGP